MKPVGLQSKFHELYVCVCVMWEYINKYEKEEK